MAFAPARGRKAREPASKGIHDMAPSATPELKLLDSEPGSFAFYTWQNIMIACWSKRAEGHSIERIARLRESMADAHPEGVSVIYLIANEAGLPTAEARAGVRQLMARFSKQRACLAIVIQGEGFWASGMRAVITGVRLLVPIKFPMGVFAGVDAVAQWLPEWHERRTGVRLAPGQLLGVLEQLMAAL
jgi:hypothetical protein